MTNRFFSWLGISGLVIIFDQVTKWMVREHLALGDAVRISGFFDIVFVYNRGAAFSFLSTAPGWQRWFFIVLAFAISGWLLTLLKRHQREILQPLAFVLIIGGALGNVIDRIRFGAVVDFLYFHLGSHDFPAFNVADSAICLGVGLMIVAQIRDSQAAKQSESAT